MQKNQNKKEGKIEKQNKANTENELWSKGYIIKDDQIKEVEQNFWTGTIKIIEYRHGGTIFKTEQEAVAWLALKRATETRNEILEREEKKWWKIWK